MDRDHSKEPARPNRFGNRSGEALTASDRPYKKAMPLETVYRILRSMADNEELDPNLVDLFIDQEVYKIYQKKHENGPKEKQTF